ncbi:MAG TPA: ABC transporter ATP-binding protein [Chloroflexota bacterium]|nr:ABC transporter ATP-binding protein [Chloroflexota bacterium]
MSEARAGGPALLLDVRRVSKRFGGLVAVNDVDFTVEAGRIVSLIGPNGAGKTTLFNIVAGFYPPTSGEIYFKGQPIHRLAPHQITARGIARTFQNVRLFPNLTVLENVLVGMHCRLTSTAFGAVVRPPWYLKEERAARQRALELLELMQLRPYALEGAANLPYGLRRRLEVARALAAAPQLLLLDEPTAGMNPLETASMIALIRRLRDELALAVLLIEHDMRLVMGISERVTVLNYGRKIAEGTPEEVQRNEQVIEAYLGRRHLGQD